MPYLFAAYAIFWGLTFVLVFSIWARQRRLEREVKILQEQREQKATGNSLMNAGLQESKNTG